MSRPNSPRMDVFADLLANGATPGEAARRMALPTKSGAGLLQSLRRRLGAQAI